MTFAATTDSADTRGTLIVLTDPASAPRRHEAAAREVVARRLAQLLGYRFGGAREAGDPPPAAAYFVPARTLLAHEAEALGIGGEADLFGGVVPHAFVGTKAISHPVFSPAAAVPQGWEPAMADRLAGAVLPGFTAFSRDDAERAGLRLLRHGRVRIKSVTGIGGHGQAVAEDPGALAAELDRHDWTRIAGIGLVLEQDLEAATTYSVGQVRAGGETITYYGVQRHTTDNRGEQTYGGSSLMVARGGFSALLALDLPESVRVAVEQARCYDRAASRSYPGLIASRRNYDVAQGRCADGAFRSGVLEQSWRIGGASGAEVAAMTAFAADPAVAAVKASTVEIFGEEADLPQGALLLFRGVDPDEGPLTKYAVVEES